MPDGQVIQFSHLTKRFGSVTAVSDFSARIEPGRVTGFLGPNGAGKTTSLRMLLGLIRPTAGTATIGGKRYADLAHPMREVGAALEASSFHPGRSGASHLKVYAQAAGVPLSRVDEVLGLVGLSDAASRRVGGYSLGMRQRLGLATALLGDPGVLVLDEPANGLDPEGIRWMRGFLRQLAGEGRTVLTSSHVLTEVAQTVHGLVIIAQGRRVFQGQLWELAASDESSVVVDSPDRAALVTALRGADVTFEVLRAGLVIRGADATEIGAIVAAAGVPLSTLHKRGPALEEVFLELVNGMRVHPSAQGIAGQLEAGSDDDGQRALEAAQAPEADAEPAAEAETAPEAETSSVSDAAEQPVAEEPAVQDTLAAEPASETGPEPVSDAAAPPSDTDAEPAASDETPVSDAPLTSDDSRPVDDEAEAPESDAAEPVGDEDDQPALDTPAETETDFGVDTESDAADEEGDAR